MTLEKSVQQPGAPGSTRGEECVIWRPADRVRGMSGKKSVQASQRWREKEGGRAVGQEVDCRVGEGQAGSDSQQKA